MVGQKYINPAEMSHPTNQNQGHSSNEPNRLIHTNSPYLQQHAYNPVDWQPWCDEAWQEAKSKNKLVLVSIGYSTCHWCHVMAHESFEDPGVAALMNEHFVCVKVDREERPDVDSVYMEVTQALTGHGGWPMTVFTDVDARPFYAGTYYPPQPRHGLPSFPQLLSALSEAWNERYDDVVRSGKVRYVGCSNFLAYQLARAIGRSEACDVFLSVGTSAVVYPAAELPLVAKRTKASPPA